MIYRYALFAGLLAGTFFTAQAQPGSRFGFEYRPVAKVVQGTDTLQHAWAGGLNTPQFSSIDLDGDGRNDLFALDRESSRLYTFLNVANPAGGRRWQYEPNYEALFPTDLFDWALLRDYDCDGRPDLFTNNGTYGVRIYHNVAGPGGRASFVLTTAQLRTTQNAPINIGNYNMPDLRDVDGDGKLDLITYDGASYLSYYYYRNTSAGTCGGALAFTLQSSTWGNIAPCTSCASYVFPGPPTTPPCTTVQRPLHSPGHNIMLIDLDGDGDQDVLDGLDGCPQLVRLLNQGTAALATFPGSGMSASFPTAAAPMRAVNYPAGYLLDADLDGRLDVVIAPNLYTNIADRVSLRQPVNLYRDAATSGAPALTAVPQGFLQRDIIDVSEVAAPTFGDIDGDGLKDMLVGNFADELTSTSGYVGSVAYYRNVGTSRRPVFRLITTDYLGLAARRFYAFKPTLVDLNRDGALDLAFSATDFYIGGACFFYYILNTAAPNQPLALDITTLNRFKPTGATGTGILPYMEGSMPCFTDVDNDGYVDLLVGTNERREPGMSLRYFRNRGRGPLDSAFVLVNNDFGQIRSQGRRPSSLSPVVADFDGDGRPDLLTADSTGTIRFFGDYRSQTGRFTERTDLLYNSLTNQDREFALGTYVRYGLAAADIDNDGAPELYVGQEAGGILAYATRHRLATANRTEAAQKLALQVYPNPAQTTASVATATPTRLALLDLAGRTVRPAGPAARQHTLDLTGLAAGLYLLRAEAADGTVAVERLSVR